ncbi:MAG TPA: hypothetical protein VE422_30650 [Terriglobia bacterium]|nr:hypothetical protein [Terriglobia bacterium]
MTKTTPEDVVKKIREHGATGRQAWQRGDLKEAEEEFLHAWNSLPEPRTGYDHGQSLSRGLVTFYRDTRQFEKAKGWLDVTREAYESTSDPSVEFLAGTVHYEAGELDEAFRIFDGLYQQFGQRPFQGVKRDYLDFYKRKVQEGKPK